MRYLKYAALFGVLLFAAANANAQFRVGVAVGSGYGPVYGGYYGPAPVCAYGYYDYYPYECAPYGYWGPSYFVNGIFIGAGPWFHSHGFHNHGFHGRGFDRGFRGSRGFSGGGFRGGFGASGLQGSRAGAFRGGNGGGFRGGNSFSGGGSGFHGGGGGFRGAGGTPWEASGRARAR